MPSAEGSGRLGRCPSQRMRGFCRSLVSSGRDEPGCDHPAGLAPRGCFPGTVKQPHEAAPAGQQGQHSLPHHTEGETGTGGEVVPRSSPPGAEPPAQRGAAGPAHPLSLQTPAASTALARSPYAPSSTPAPHLTQPSSPFASGETQIPHLGQEHPQRRGHRLLCGSAAPTAQAKTSKTAQHPNPNTSGESCVAFPAVPQSSQRSPSSLRPSPRPKHPLNARHWRHRRYRRHGRLRKGCCCGRADPVPPPGLLRPRLQDSAFLVETNFDGNKA